MCRIAQLLPVAWNLVRSLKIFYTLLQCLAGFAVPLNLVQDRSGSARKPLTSFIAIGQMVQDTMKKEI